MGTQQQGNGSSLMVQGRIVWTSGDLHKGQHQKDDRTKQLKYDQQGNPTIVFGFGLAVPKIDPRTGQFTEKWVNLYQSLQAEALTLYPNGHIPQAFSMKYKDGDVDIDPSGVPYSKREGYAGHVVLACTTQLPIKYFRFEGGNNILVNDGFKNGDYVNVQLNIKAHPPVGQGIAGIYVNPSAVQFIQAGKEIINTPSGDQLFGMNAPAYAGEVIAHQAPAMPQMGQPALGPQGQPALGPQGQPAGYGHQAPAMPTQGYPAQASQQPAPHYGVLPQTHQPQAPAIPSMGNGYAPQATPAYPNQGTTQVNGYPNPSINGQPVPNTAYPSNPVMPPQMPGMQR